LFIIIISKSKTIILFYVFRIYNIFFEYLYKAQQKLITKVKSKKYNQALVLVKIIKITKKKINKYYYKIYYDLGSIYIIRILLDFFSKLESFRQLITWLDYNFKD
jgi:hypothetical protein